MTFDEALDELKQEAFWSTGFPEIQEIEFEKLKYAVEKLREEYAPTVEMTKEQYDYINPLIQQGKELGATFTEFWEVYKFIGASKKIDRTFDSQERAMQAWLHPETIKVIGENNDAENTR